MSSSALSPLAIPFHQTRLELMAFVRERAFDTVNLIDPSHADPVFLERLLELIGSLRNYLVCDKRDLERIWTTIRSNENLTDYLLTLTSDLAFMLNSTSQTFQLITDQFVDSVCIFRNTSDPLSAIDEDLVLSMPSNTTEMKPLFGSNPWYITLLLLRQCGFVETFATAPSTTGTK